MRNARLNTLPGNSFLQLAALLDGLAPGGPGAPISLALGEPQHPVPALAEAAARHNLALYGKYPPAAGTPDWRAAVAGWIARRYGAAGTLIDPERHILPVSGTREALYLIAQLCTPRRQAGDQPLVLIPNPFYQCYAAATAAAGAQPVYCPATAQNGFLPDFIGRPEAELARVSLVYCCSPANPQGVVASRDYLCALIRTARAHDFIVAFDECYSEIYDHAPPVGALEACAALADEDGDRDGALRNVVVFNSLSKRSSVPGLRSGFVAGDGDVLAAFHRLRSLGGAVPSLHNLSVAGALWDDEDHVARSRALYRQKLDIAQEILGDAFGFYRPAGGFFLWLEVGDGEAAARALWREAGVKILPGRYLACDDEMGHNPAAGFIRLALVHDLAITRDALGRLKRCLA